MEPTVAVETPQEIMIAIHGVGKSFKLPHEKHTSIKSAVVNFYRTKRSYEIQKALQDVSFDIKKGEFFGIIGRNGSGKSTLLKLLAGIYTPTTGTIDVRGHLTPFIELGVGFNQELTGRENVYLNGALLGFSRKEMDRMYDDIVDFAEIERFMDQKLKNYSSGMQVRLAFSIAIRAESDILLVDEVLAVGDQSFQEKCFRYFDEIKRTGRTVVFISHDGGAIERFCDRVAIVDRGELIDVGASKDMVLKYGAIVAEEEYGNEQSKGVGEQKGTGLITIQKVEVVSKNKATHGLRFGSPFSIRAAYTAKQVPEEKAIIGIDIIDDQGVSVLGPNTLESPNIDVNLTKKGTIEATFSTNPLSPGTYSVTVGIFNERSTFAHTLWEHATEFKIIGEGRHGKIYIEPEWSIT